ncbi:MAG: von Willebrand factor type A domain-containing protein [Verrucomicrobiota bacterium]
MNTHSHTDPETEFPPPGGPEVRATAWALEELDAEERAAFEKEMAADPQLAAYAREMRVFCAEVGAELPPETDDSQLTMEEIRRSPVIAALSQSPDSGPTGNAGTDATAGNGSGRVVRGNFLRNHWKGLILTTAAAACLTLTLRPAWLPDPGGNGTGPLVKRDAADAIAPFVPGGQQATESKAEGTADGNPPGSLIAAVTPAPPSVTIRPVMPHMLFQGTPLPRTAMPPNFDQSTNPVLEVAVPVGTVLLSKGCPVTSSDPDPIGDLSLITDGDKQGDDGYFVDLLPGKVWVTIDLGKPADINLLWVWHFHKQGVVFNDVIVQVSDDPAFKAFTTVFNNDYDNSMGFGVGPDQTYVETNNGRAMPVKGVRGRYVRLHSNGRSLDDTNQYIEVEVYGRPAEAPAESSLLAAAGTRIKADDPPAKAVEGETTLLAKTETALKQLADGIQNEKLEEGNSQATGLLPPPAAAPAATVRPAMPGAIFQGTPLPLYATNPASPSPPNTVRWTSQPGAIRTYSGTESKNKIHNLYSSATPAVSDSLALMGRESKFPAESRSAESYQSLPVNPFLDVTAAPLSTFSIDVDTASYSNVRRFLNAGGRPPAEAVRLEELVNYFPYDEPPPEDGKPFAVRVNVVSAPWNAQHRLARIVLKGKEIAAAARPASNLVFLVDVSGSMNEPSKLPLVQQSLRLLTERLTENDRVSIVTYAGSSGVVLPSTNGQDKARILAAIDGLQSAGGTNGAGGITTAYAQAAQHFIKDGVNRVILATDGDFNIGVTSHDDLLNLITEKAKSGVFLSVLGYGMGNLKDDTMELLSDKGNGNYAYIDSLSEARKSLVEQMSGTLVTIAKDVKIQIEFNPSVVKSYKLLGYENRLLAKEDFNNDKKDAGEIGAGHTVTALYEIVPAGAPEVPVNAAVDGLKYQQTPAVAVPRPQVTPAADSGEMMNVKLRWKQPQGETSELMEVPVKDSGASLDQASGETRWAVAVAGFARLLRGDTVSGTETAAGAAALTWETVRQLARGAKGPDPLGYRGEFLQLIDKAESLTR